MCPRIGPSYKYVSSNDSSSSALRSCTAVYRHSSPSCFVTECFVCVTPGVLENTSLDSTLSIHASVHAHSSRGIWRGELQFAHTSSWASESSYAGQVFAVIETWWALARQLVHGPHVVKGGAAVWAAVRQLSTTFSQREAKKLYKNKQKHKAIKICILSECERVMNLEPTVAYDPHLKWDCQFWESK